MKTLEELITCDDLPSPFPAQFPAKLPVSCVTSRAEELCPSALFFHLRGVRGEREKDIGAILACPPAAVITETELRGLPENIPQFPVKDARSLLSHALYRFFDLEGHLPPLVGITGTNGKTSTAAFLTSALRAAGKRVGSIGTGYIRIGENTVTDPFYSMTTPDPEVLYPALRQMTDEGCDVIVMEVSSHALALGKVAPLRFSSGIFTGLASDHMDFHKTREEYIRAKSKLFLQSDLSILNADDPVAARMAKAAACGGGRVLFAGAVYPGDARATQITQDGIRGARYFLRYGSLSLLMDEQIAGVYQVYNSMLAFLCAVELGVPPCVAKTGIGSLTAIAGRGEILSTDPTVILDYAHTAKALESILKVINSSKNKEQKIITIFGCGGDRDVGKRPEMAEVAARYSDFCVVTDDNPRTEDPKKIIADICEGFSDRKNVRVIPDRRQAIEETVLAAQSTDLILLAGKGHEQYQITKDGKIFFDERKIVAEALKKRKDGYTAIYENHT